MRFRALAVSSILALAAATLVPTAARAESVTGPNGVVSATDVVIAGHGCGSTTYTWDGVHATVPEASGVAFDWINNYSASLTIDGEVVDFLSGTEPFVSHVDDFPQVAAARPYCDAASGSHVFCVSTHWSSYRYDWDHGDEVQCANYTVTVLPVSMVVRRQGKVATASLKLSGKPWRVSVAAQRYRYGAWRTTARRTTNAGGVARVPLSTGPVRLIVGATDQPAARSRTFHLPKR